LSPQLEAVQKAVLVTDFEPGGKQITVLLVEDEPFVREAAGYILESAGYRVLKAPNAAEAKRKFGGGVQVLLTDVILPDADGRDLAEELNVLYPGMHAIFMSGYPESALNGHQAESPTVAYLAKPFSVESLTAKMRQAEHAMAEVHAIAEAQVIA